MRNPFICCASPFPCGFQQISGFKQMLFLCATFKNMQSKGSSIWDHNHTHTHTRIIMPRSLSLWRHTTTITAEEENRSSCYKYAAYFWALHNLAANFTAKERERLNSLKSLSEFFRFAHKLCNSCSTFRVCESVEDPWMRDVICVEKWVSFLYTLR